MELRNQFGLHTYSALQRQRVADEEMRHAIDIGELTPVARGLAATPRASRTALEAIDAGWRPTCTSAAAAQGLWVPWSPDRRLHAYKARTRRDAAPRGVVPHGWHDTWPEDERTATIPELMRHATRCQDLETCVVLAESALNQCLLTPEEWQRIVAAAPKRYHRILSRAVTASESGSETRVRLAFEAHRIPVEVQVRIEGLGRVDLVVKGKLVVECDSRRHHSSPKDWEEDRRRDLILHALGYVVVRLSYDQIWRSWDETWDMLLAMFRRLRWRERRPLSA